MRYFIFTALIFCITFIPVLAATNVYIDTDSKVPLDQEFVIYLLIDSDKSINTVSAELKIPEGLEIKGIDNGGSIINFFIDKPVYDKESRIVTFSGIIPGGFLGKGTLVRLFVTSSDEGLYRMTGSYVDLYANNETSEKERLAITASEFIVDKNTPSRPVYKDIDAPESFSITVTKNQLIYDNALVAFFGTQDKDSGINRYELAEKEGEIEKDYKSLAWRIVESPVVLSDQDFKSFIYVKAVDNVGNERVEVLEPKYPITFYDKIVYEVLPLLLLLFIAYITWRLWRNQFTIRR